eukprot:CAMPEP_0197487378 /NCGR_PEP_ID=MMETSP1311-20131121/2403_1 /TAXON_ID=464262 /ORGANISM="Genus nov. species nov., Strain RCC856" /LENGTH=212 /DNA_ID=CAMNT_0043031003 /DNA_START=96 /DNA_END=731 /DNA_ORIENTATION=+
MGASRLCAVLAVLAILAASVTTLAAGQYTGPADYTTYSTKHQYTFPAKSVNLTSPQLHSPQFYHLFVFGGATSDDGREQGVTLNCDDPHPVHGIEASDASGFVVVGKCISNPESAQAQTQAFALKVDWSGALLWAWTSGLVNLKEHLTLAFFRVVIELPGAGGGASGRGLPPAFRARIQRTQQQLGPPPLARRRPRPLENAEAAAVPPPTER